MSQQAVSNNATVYEETNMPHCMAEVENLGTVSCDSQQVIQNNMTRMIQDLDRRQEIIQDLVKNNDILKHDSHQVKSEVSDLRQLLMSAKDKIQEIEGEKHSLISSIQAGRGEATASQLADKVDRLQITCLQQQEQISQLNKRLKKLLKLKEQDRDNSYDDHMIEDRRIVEYKLRIKHLEADLSKYRKPRRSVLSEIDSTLNTNCTDEYAITSKQEAKQGTVAKEVSIILLSLQQDAYTLLQISKMRAQKKHAEKMKAKLGQLECAITRASISAEETAVASRGQLATVQNLFKMLKVEDELSARKKICELKAATKHYARLKQFTEEVISLVNDATTSNQPANDTSSSIHEPWCERTYEIGLMNLRKLLQSSSGAANSSRQTCDLPISMKNACPISDHTEYARIIDHLQKLFDVKTLGGVFPRMNDIYMKLGETHNVMHTLKELLGLSEDKKSITVVNAVGRLCDIQKSTTYQQLSQLLQEQDLGNVIVRLKEYERFFPTFDATMTELMQTLGVSSMKQVVPAVQALKLLAP